MHDPEDLEPASEQLERLYGKLLMKAAVRSVIWLLLALAVVHFFPSHRWVLYVALVFVGIAVLLTIAVKVAAIVVSRREGS